MRLSACPYVKISDLQRTRVSAGAPALEIVMLLSCHEPVMKVRVRGQQRSKVWRGQRHQTLTREHHFHSIQINLTFVATVTINIASRCLTTRPESGPQRSNGDKEELPLNRKKPWAGPAWYSVMPENRLSRTVQSSCSNSRFPGSHNGVIWTFLNMRNHSAPRRKDRSGRSFREQLYTYQHMSV